MKISEPPSLFICMWRVLTFEAMSVDPPISTFLDSQVINCHTGYTFKCGKLMQATSCKQQHSSASESFAHGVIFVVFIPKLGYMHAEALRAKQQIKHSRSAATHKTLIYIFSIILPKIKLLGCNLLGTQLKKKHLGNQSNWCCTSIKIRDSGILCKQLAWTIIIWNTPFS